MKLPYTKSWGWKRKLASTNGNFRYACQCEAYVI